MQVEVQGIASHAGVAPEAGVSAITIASLAIAQLHQDGWLGKVAKGNRQGTSNIGVIHGGEATNVVTPRVELRAEARSHNPAFRAQIVRAIEQAFQKAAKSVRNTAGVTGKVAFEGELHYESFKLPDDDPSVLAAEAAIRAEGGAVSCRQQRRLGCQLDEPPGESPRRLLGLVSATPIRRTSDWTSPSFTKAGVWRCVWLPVAESTCVFADAVVRWDQQDL